jgi:hypothetical protein
VRQSAWLRRTLAEVADGIRSAAEGDLRNLIRAAGLPPPMFNARLYIGPDLLAVPDAWWPDAGVAAEVESREWHLSPEDWERTMSRSRRMGAKGILLVQASPHQIRPRRRGSSQTYGTRLRPGGPGHPWPYGRSQRPVNQRPVNQGGSAERSTGAAGGRAANRDGQLPCCAETSAAWPPR